MTILVYMAADNDLESHAIRNLKDMERADFNRMNVLASLATLATIDAQAIV